jgi:galactokinase
MPGAAQWSTAWQIDDGCEQATSLLRTRIDAAPDTVASAPGRVNLIGEHTDYNAGLCLPLVLPHRTYVALRVRDDDIVRLISAQEPDSPWHGELGTVGPGTVDGWAGYAVGVAWALREAGQPLGGFDAAIDSCVPVGAGLSSSAALEAAMVLALDGAFGLGLTSSEDGGSALVAACIRAENEIAGAPTGGMDQVAALRSKPGHALLLDFRSGARRDVPFDPAGAGLALLVIDTRARHSLGDGQYGERRAACARAAEFLGIASLREVTDLDAALAALPDETSPDGTLRRRVRHVVTEMARVEAAVAALDRADFAALGSLFDASHASLRDDYQVSCRELDLAVAAAREAGALGARMTGGGFGGSAIALVPAADVDRITTAVGAAFDDGGSRAPMFLDATP